MAERVRIEVEEDEASVQIRESKVKKQESARLEGRVFAACSTLFWFVAGASLYAAPAYMGSSAERIAEQMLTLFVALAGIQLAVMAIMAQAPDSIGTKKSEPAVQEIVRSRSVWSIQAGILGAVVAGIVIVLEPLFAGNRIALHVCNALICGCASVSLAHMYRLSKRIAARAGQG